MYAFFYQFECKSSFRNNKKKKQKKNIRIHFLIDLNVILFFKVISICYLMGLKTRGPGATIRSSDKTAIAYLLMPCNFLPPFPQQLEHIFGHTVKRSNVILVSSFKQTYYTFIHDAIFQDSASKLSLFWS